MVFFGGKKKKKEKPAANGSPTEVDPDAPTQIAPHEDAPPQFSDKDIAAARKWFAQAKKLTDDRNFDYAIESYIQGLKRWPEAVEEGHQPLRVAAYMRWEKGGKKPSTLDAMKHSMSGRDSIQAMLNAEWLWARDPHNLSYMEGMIKNANKAKCEQALLFIGPIYFEAIKNEKKFSKDRFMLIRKAYDESGNRCERRGDLGLAMEFYEGALTVLQMLERMSPTSLELSQQLKNLATRVAIIKGHYDSEGDFRDSVRDANTQKGIHDRDRAFVGEERLEELIDEARKDWQANPAVSAKLFALVELICRKEDEAHENEAMELLLAEYKSTSNYAFKMRADDIRLKQLRRRVRIASRQADPEAAKKAKLNLLKYELGIYQERVKTYPTDNKLKYEYGRLLTRIGKFDDAIPVLQDARNDPKNRYHCMNLIGRCFYEKDYHTQAISTYQQAIKDYELVGDELSKDLHYWLGRSHESAGNSAEAEKAYGQVIQWDYNYRDVRKRLDDLSNSPD